MRILQFITGLRLGGAEKQLLLLANALQQYGNVVKVVAMETGGVVAAEFKGQHIEVQELGVRKISNLPAAYRKFTAIVKDFKPDVIHSHMVHANLMARYFKLFNKGYKLICTAHNIKEGGALTMLGYRLTKTIPNWSSNVSREAYAYFIEKGYFNKQASSFVPNATDTDMFNPNRDFTEDLRGEFHFPDNAYVFLSAGRLHPQKNHKLLLNAFKRTSDKLKDAYLVIAGEGPLLQALKEYADELGIANRVVFAGRCDDMPQLLAMCNCFVLSSDYEGFGLVVAEAMAMLKPVIATDCGGVKEVTGGYGILIKPLDIDGMALAMYNIHKSPPQTEQLLKARAYIEQHYSVKHVLNQWLNIYSN